MGLRVGGYGREQGELPHFANEKLNAYMREAIEDATDITEDLTKALTPKRRPYTFSTVRSVVMGGGGPRAEGHIGSNDEIFYYMNEGTGEHPIFPNEKEALWWPGAQHPVKYVRRHPGTRPHNQLDNAARAGSGVAKMKLRDAMQRAFS